MQNDTDIKGGWIKSYRKTLEWEWFRDVFTAHFFQYCTLRAAHKDDVWRGIVIKRGSFLSSINAMSVETGLSVQSVRTAINKLQSTGEITSQSTNKYTIISVCNYDIYQDVQHGEQQASQQTEQQAEQQAKQQTQQQQTRIIRSKEEKNNIISSPNGDVSDLPSDAAPAEEEIKGEKINYPKLVAYWNNQTQGIFGCKLVSIENTRRKRVRARIAQYGKEKFIEAIHKVCESEYLRGATWFSFDWMVRPNNFDKVISGNYDNRQQQPGQQPSKLGAGTVTRPQEDTEEVRTDF